MVHAMLSEISWVAGGVVSVAGVGICRDKEVSRVGGGGWRGADEDFFMLPGHDAVSS